MFFHEYTTEERYHPIREIDKIALRYFLGEFFEHLLALVPFNLLIGPITEE
jgi:hypothetical protein